jgi:hypothetical protein
VWEAAICRTGTAVKRQLREAAGWKEGTAVGRQALEIAAGGRNSAGYDEKEENVYYPDASGISM